MIKLADNLIYLLLKQAAAAEAAPTPTNPNAGFTGVPATTSFYQQLAARDGAEEAIKKIDSARAYQQSHPTELPENKSVYVPTYSTESVNRQFPIVIKDQADFGQPDTAAYYSSNDDNVTVLPQFASSMATGPTTTRKLIPNLGVHELTHAITPFSEDVRNFSNNYQTTLPRLTRIANERKKEVEDGVPHDLTSAELTPELSDAKYMYSKSTGRSTIMTTPEEQKAFRDWAYSTANPSAVKQTDGSYGPTSDSVWGQLNNLTPEQQSYLMGSVVKGQTPQQPTNITPYSQYQA